MLCSNCVNTGGCNFFLNLKKFIKLHENELVENNIKDTMVRVVAMTIISLFIGVIGIVLQFI